MGEVRITVRVKPGSSQTRVGGSYGGDRQLVVCVSEPPVHGAANEAVLRAVADALGVRHRHVSLISRTTARSKVIAVSVAGPEEAALRERLIELLG